VDVTGSELAEVCQQSHMSVTGHNKGSAVGQGLVSLLGPEEISISISLLLPCLVAGCRLGNIMGTDGGVQRKFAPVIMAWADESVCTKDDGVDQEVTIE